MATPIIVSSIYRDGASSGLGRTEGRLRSLGRTAGTVGRATAVGLGLAGAAAVTLGKESVREASLAQQSLGATESVYGKYADTVVRRSRQAADAVGLSANEYRELNNVLGATLTASGMPLKQTADLTDRLTGRASDLAATFGGTTKEAIEAVSSLLRGEADPIERYGVSIKQSDVNARLAAKGQDKLTGAAAKSAEQQARLDLLFRQTNKSAGQFGRESNTLAGQQQRLGAQVDNLQAKVGARLLPRLTELATYANDKVVPAADRLFDALSGKGSGDLGETADGARVLGEAFRDAWPEIKAAADELPSLGDTLKVTSTVIGFAADNVDTLAKSLPLLVAGFVAFKGVQLLSNAATALSPALRLAEVLAIRRQTIAIRELSAAQATAGGAVVGGRGSGAGIAAVGTQAAAATSKVSRFGRAAAVAGGVAGVGALASGAGQGSRAATVLGGAVSGAMLGAFAGPLGAAVGGVAGGVLAFATSTDQAKESVEEAVPPTANYADTLDRLSGAAGRATRAEAFRMAQEEGVLGITSKLGISARDLTGAVTGQTGATNRVARAWRENASALDANEQGKFSEFLRDQTGALGRQRSELLQSERATLTWKQALKGLPEDVRTRLKLEDYNPTRRQLQDIIRDTGGLSRRQTRILIREFGAGKVRRTVRGLTQDLKRTGNTNPNIGPWARELHSGVQGARRRNRGNTRGIDRDLRNTGKGARPNLSPFAGAVGRGVGTAQQSARRGTSGLNRLLSQGTRGARPNLRNFTRGITDGVRTGTRTAQRGGTVIARGAVDPVNRARPNLSGYNSGISSGVAAGRGIASSGGFGVGANLKSGVIAGFSGTASALASQAASAVNQAIAAANRAAQSRSPSRRGIKVTKNITDGFRIGFERGKAGVNRASSKLINSVLGSATKDVSAVQDRLRALGKEYGRKADRVNAVVRALAKSEKRLVTNRKNVERLTEKLKNSTRVYKEAESARKEYAAGVRSSILDSASLAGIEEGHLNDPQALLASRQALLANAQRFDAAIRALRGKLNNADLQALVDAGPQQGLAAAESLVAGLGSGVVDQMNTIQGQLASLGASLGDRVSKDFLGAGVAAKRKLMNADQKSLNTANRTGARLAASLLKGFGTRLDLGKAFNKALFGGGGGGGNKRNRRAEQLGRQLAQGIRTGATREAQSPRARTAQPAQRTGGGQGGGQLVEVRLTAKDITDAMAGRQVKKWIRAADKADKK